MGYVCSQTNSGIAKLAEWPEETPLGNSVQDRGPAVATLPSPLPLSIPHIPRVFSILLVALLANM